MDFKNTSELLALCQNNNIPISEVMRFREVELGETSDEEVNCRMTHALEIMKKSSFAPIHTPGKSMGGLLGGEARKLIDHHLTGKGI